MPNDSNELNARPASPVDKIDACLKCCANGTSVPGATAENANMKLAIPPEIIAATTQCRKGFACLTQPGATICKAETGTPGNILFVQCAATLQCHYKTSFGYGNICQCPTRKAIYNRQHI